MSLFNQLLFTALIIAVLWALYSALLRWLRTPLHKSESSLRRVTGAARLASFTRSRKSLPTDTYYDS
jgi:hypothetical protein